MIVYWKQTWDEPDDRSAVPECVALRESTKSIVQPFFQLHFRRSTLVQLNVGSRSQIIRHPVIYQMWEFVHVNVIKYLTE